ncbi:MAG: hypothetical protein HYZ53_23745, partial [Planctomycetes bacterium]|nr:hypothetical protein [Planctomycetota bacterium]
ALLGSGVAVAFLLFLGRVVDWMPRESVYALLLLAGLVVGWVAAVARLLVSVFGQSSYRLGELLLTLLLAETLVAAFFGQTSGPRSQLGNRVLALLLAQVLALGLAGAGSAWGWSAAARSAEERPGRRVLLLFAGWGLVAGTLGWGALLFLIFELLPLRELGTFGPWLICLALPLPFVALSVEYRLRRRESPRLRRMVAASSSASPPPDHHRP